MLSMDVRPSHSMAQVRKEARNYFGAVLGLEEGATSDPGTTMMFTGAGGFVTIEFSQGNGQPSVLLHSREFDGQVREFARIIA
ncbi:MAG: hypothetical protein WD058_08385 [Dehalococcoidia bacterium]